MNLNLNTFSLKGKGLYISRTIEPLCLWYRKKTLMCFDLTLKHTRSSDSLVSKASVRDLLVRPYRKNLCRRLMLRKLMIITYNFLLENKKVDWTKYTGDSLIG